MSATDVAANATSLVTQSTLSVLENNIETVQDAVESTITTSTSARNIFSIVVDVILSLILTVIRFVKLARKSKSS